MVALFVAFMFVVCVLVDCCQHKWASRAKG
jgi:hypothetical protein